MRWPYDTLGIGYRGRRRADPRIRRAITSALGSADSVLDVGAGTGSYEPLDRLTVAVEPAITMIHQRPDGAAPVVRATASVLPFEDRAFDASLAVLTIHHWSELRRGLGELLRVARDRAVILTWDPAVPGFWLSDYFPEILRADRAIFPSMDELEDMLGSITVSAVPIPHDCSDGFLGAYWRRPAAYLHAGTRLLISTFSRITRVDVGLARLRSDLESGEWRRRYGELLTRLDLDLGYRLVVAELSDRNGNSELLHRSPA
jgi:SAM-dependent methyltransferase